MGEVSGDDIESISLEYNQVFIMRPWLKPEIFLSTQWKLPGGAVVSDGGTPRRGMIPAYVSSMLVVRNIQVIRKKTPASKETVIPLIGKFAVHTLSKELSLIRHASVVAPPPAAATATAVAFIQPHELKPIVRDHRTSVDKSTLFSLGNPSPSPAANRPSDTHRVALLQKRIYERANYETAVRVPAASAVIRADVIVMRPDLVLHPTKPTSEIVTEDYSFDGVIVLAFVCKRVTKCPNPDNSLEWV
jgi:hypothetical protein